MGQVSGVLACPMTQEGIIIHQYDSLEGESLPLKFYPPYRQMSIVIDVVLCVVFTVVFHPFRFALSARDTR